MTTASPNPVDGTKARGTPPQQPAKNTATPEQQGRRKVATVSWYGTLLIVGTLLIAAGWEIFRWILVIITLD